MSISLPERYRSDNRQPVLGEGGMGRVLKAHDVYLKVPVAIKVVRPSLSSDHRFRKLFDLEVKVSARFTHPNIVPLHDYGELDDGSPFLAMALADAGSFSSLQSDVQWEEIMRLTIELLDALSHLHARGVLHRDIKPENILLHYDDQRERHVWLADLGLANAGSILAKKKGRVEGTPGFMAPEQRLGLPREYGPWTDLYSVGVVLWDLLTGGLPFGEEGSALDQPLRGFEPRAGFAVPEGIEQILYNTLRLDPLSRYDLAADLKRDLLSLGPAVERPISEAMGDGPMCYISVPSVKEGEPFPTAFSLDCPDWNRPKNLPLPALYPREVDLVPWARSSMRLFSLREMPLISRDTELQVLWEAARSVTTTGISKVMLVVGEAGAGKSRLVDGLVRKLEELGCSEAVNISYRAESTNLDGYVGAARELLKPWKEQRGTLQGRLSRKLAREHGALDDDVVEEALLLTKWCGLLDEDEQPVPAGIGLREVHRHLSARVWRGLSVLTLDNVQWATEEGDGLAIAESVAQGALEGEQTRRLVVVTIRSEECVGVLAERVRALEEMGADRIDLQRLGRDGTLALLKESLSLTVDLAEQVAKRCQGNPLFARQLLVDWVEKGLLVDKGGLTFGLKPGVSVESALPEDASVVFLARIERLGRNSTNQSGFEKAIKLIALAGEVVPLSLFKSVAFGDMDLYTYLLASGLWVEEENQVRFDHGLLRQAILSSTEGADDLCDLHHCLSGIWLSNGEQSGTPNNWQVGRHAFLAQEWEQALIFLVRAAQNAFKQGLTQRMFEAGKLAVKAADKMGCFHVESGVARYWYGRAVLLHGNGNRAADLLVGAITQLSRLDNSPLELPAMIGLAQAEISQGHLDGAEKVLRRVIDLARARSDLANEVEAILWLAQLEQQKRNFAGADILFIRAQNRFDSLGDQRGLAEATIGAAEIANLTGRYSEAKDLFNEAGELFEQVGDLAGVANARRGIGVVAMANLDVAAAIEHLQAAIGMAEELGATKIMMKARQGMAVLHRSQGYKARSLELYGAYLSWAKRNQVFEAAIEAHLGIATVSFSKGEYLEASRATAQAAKILDKVPGHWLWATYQLLVAALFAIAGEEDATYTWLWRATEFGLIDAASRDAAWYLGLISDIAGEEKWPKVTRVSANAASAQWELLGDREKSSSFRDIAASCS